MLTRSNPPRVLYFTDTWIPQVNGVSVVTALSVDGLQDRGWEVGVVAPAYPLDLPDPFHRGALANGFRAEVPSMAIPGYRDLRLVTPFSRLGEAAVEAFRPDLVHCATEFLIGRMGQRAALRRGIPVVSSYHTDFSRYTVSYGVSWLREPVARTLTRFHQRSARVYTPSVPASEDLRRLGLTDIEVWGRGVDAQAFHPRHRDADLHRAYAGEHGTVLLHVGRLAAEKGIEVLIAAFLRAREQLKDVPVQLVVAGEGPREGALRRQAGSHVTFLGNLDRRTMLPRLYASCDAFLFASETETLGLVILEAMASGLPVVAAPAGGVADHLRDGINGLAYPAGDVNAMAEAIVAMVRDPARRKALAAGARATAQGMDWANELARLDQSYREVLHSSAKVARAS